MNLKKFLQLLMNRIKRQSAEWPLFPIGTEQLRTDALSVTRIVNSTCLKRPSLGKLHKLPLPAAERPESYSDSEAVAYAKVA